MTRSNTSVSLALAGIAFAAGCATLAPLAVKFGADLISSASANYSQKYANKVQDLMQGMYAKATQKAQPQQTASADPYASAYPQTSSAYPQTSSAYPSSSPYPAQSDPYPPASGSSQSPYPSDSQSPYPSAQASPYPSALSGQGAYGASSAIVVEATILAQRAGERAAGRTAPVPIQDGDTLRGGGSDPKKGDVIKVSFRANCDCYVYVVGADATGFIAQIFPDPASGLSNPVQANRQYVVPEGTQWYGLDQFRGIEHVFFVASRAPRPDIEGPLAQLAQTPRTAPPQNYRGVREVATTDSMRGLVKVQMGTPSTVQGQSGQRYAFTPQAFASQGNPDDVVVVRWFNHE